MKIVAIADTHGKHRKVDLPEGDVLVHAGDFTTFGSSREDFLDWFGSRPFEHRLLILGNHESGGFCRTSKIGIESELDNREGITYLGQHAETIGGITFGSNASDSCDVFLSHQPPKGVLDTDAAGASVGSRGVRKRCQQAEPDVHIFGHVHAAAGRRKRGDTLFVNCALAGPDYEPIRSPHVITLGGDDG